MECQENEICVNQQCTYVQSSTCMDDLECPGNDLCINRQCIPTATPVAPTTPVVQATPIVNNQIPTFLQIILLKQLL